MITKLDFDTELFGYNVGKLVVKDKFHYNKISFSKDFDLVYIFSENKLPLTLMDQKQIFQRKTGSFKRYSNIMSIKDFTFDKLRMKELTFQSGKLSRFNLDSNFRNNEYEKLYTKWFEKSIKFEISWEVLAFLENEELLGFVTLEENDNSTASIGLIAVKETERGKGIGKKLIEQAINECFLNEYKFIEVATQGLNQPAVNLYKKTGFSLKKTTYIYHLWQ
ncbi:GNAT family N-acetyltransferase [Mesohalobacter halotolerans]|uniref:GNAT family N-acetyltransferase n=1 Tax=Mesohalobacter halotolerans TaxID=1883405 RepID=A0A4U5TRT8_9FLAO|nr:GNAT family N-acetyltransferase [Mesohalobacter halotolerans]TKS56990.1 GNAT family N-acetyltransferase [Mesohalobacter halotolerans]